LFAPSPRFELGTQRLTAVCSTTELRRNQLLYKYNIDITIIKIYFLLG